MLTGEIDQDGNIKGIAYQLDGKKKKNVGEFELTFAGAEAVDTTAAEEAEAAEAEAAAAAASKAAAEALVLSRWGARCRGRGAGGWAEG